MENQSLLNGDRDSKYQKLEFESYGLEEQETLKPWQRWNKKQVVPASVLMVAGFLMMMGAKSVGPSLLDLQIRTSTSMEQVSWFISASGIGATVGSLILGKFIDHSSRWLQISTFTILMGLVLAITPWFTSFWLQFIFYILFGVTSSYAVTGAQLTIYCLFDHYVDSVTWQNIYQIALAIGGLFGPLVTQPFLLEIATENSTLNQNETTIPPGPEDVKIMYAFLIPGCLLALTGVAAFIVNFAFGTIQIYHSVDKSVTETSKNVVFPRKLTLLKFVILVLLSVYYVSQSMLVRTFNNYLLPFAVNELGWTKTKGANLAAVYFAASVVGKVLALAAVRYLSVEFMLNSGLILSNISAVALSFLIEFHESVIWIFTSVVSIGTSLTLAVMLAWTDKHIGLKGFVGVLYAVAGAAGQIGLNPVIGYLFDNVSYMSLMYLLLASTALCLVLIILLQALGKLYLTALSTLDR